jgi:hypothetical protein
VRVIGEAEVGWYRVVFRPASQKETARCGGALTVGANFDAVLWKSNPDWRGAGSADTVSALEPESNVVGGGRTD